MVGGLWVWTRLSFMVCGFGPLGLPLPGDCDPLHPSSDWTGCLLTAVVVPWGIFAVDPVLSRPGTPLPGCGRKIWMHIGAIQEAGSLL